MTTVELKSSKRKVKIRELSFDQIADLNDIPQIVFENGAVNTIKGLNKAKLAWMRAGLGGGDFDNWNANGAAPPDDVLRQLTDEEQDELVDSGQKDDDTPAFDVATGGKFKKSDFTGFDYE